MMTMKEKNDDDEGEKKKTMKGKNYDNEGKERQQ